MLRRSFLLGAGATSAIAACVSTQAPSSDVSSAQAGVAEARYPPLGSLYQVGDQQVHATDQG